MTIFEFKEEFEEFFDLLTDIKDRLPFYLLNCCLMTNHFHLLIEIFEASLSRIMKSLLQTYSIRFNLRRNRKGHIFQNRYTRKLVATNDYYLQLMRYIPLNPVKAGIAAEPENWPWSSHQEFIGKGVRKITDVRRALNKLDFDPQTALRRYHDNIQRGRMNLSELTHLPPDELQNLSETPEEIELNIVPKRDLAEIALSVSSNLGINAQEVLKKARNKPIAEARRAIVSESYSMGYTIAQIANYLSVAPSSVSRALAQRKKSNT